MGVIHTQDFSVVKSLFAASPQTLLALVIVTVIAAPVVWVLVDYVRILRLRRRMPPGPFPLPLVGNFFAIPKIKPWIAWEKWAEYYGNPMVTIWNGHRPIIMCNDIWTISDLLDKRASIYSSRARMVVMGDCLNQTTSNQVCQVYGDQWRLHRRLMHTIVGSQAVRSHRSFQSNESKILVRDLLEKPNDFVMSIERYSCSVVSIIGWGRRIDRMNDYVAQCALGFMEGVDYIIPGLFIMEAVPFLATLPGWIYPLPSTILNNAKRFQRYFYALCKEGSGVRKDNFAKKLLDQQEKTGLSNEEVACMTANLIGGGVDTTSSSMISFILAMCVFKDTQKKAQEELDRVVGRDRSPDWSDEASLPYVNALATEVLRWRTVTILGGIPHAPIQDDEYRGYLIPKDTSITGNVWAIHRNPQDFPEPDTFRPERFLNGLERPYPNKQGHNAFGWGRRVCPGQPLAEQGLFMTIARILWAYNIEPGLDDNGNEVQLDIFAYTKSENMRPEPFKARFTPRTPRIAEIILEDARIARDELRPYDGESKLTLESVG